MDRPLTKMTPAERQCAHALRLAYKAREEAMTIAQREAAQKMATEARRGLRDFWSRAGWNTGKGRKKEKGGGA